MVGAQGALGEIGSIHGVLMVGHHECCKLLSNAS
jgi:hypothetical protein